MSLNDFRSVFMPYITEKQSDGRYAVLNRECKPVGFYTKDFVTYADYPVLVNLKGLTRTKAAKISYKGCLLYTSPSPRDGLLSRMPSSA